MGTGPRPGSRPARKLRAQLQEYPDTVTAGWWNGPAVPAGLVCALSERPLLCSAALWEAGEVAVGGSDHAVYVLDAKNCKLKRTLFSRDCGHTEWVSCLMFLPDGKLLSGGMDGRLWLWGNSGIRGCEAAGHTGPIAQVGVQFSSGLAVSCSYDKSVRVWDVAGVRARCAATLAGHTAPVMLMAIAGGGTIASGDRGGSLMVWDATAGRSKWSAGSAHEGHVTALAWFDDGTSGAAWTSLLLSGGQDGRLAVWDVRARRVVHRAAPHANAQGRGAVGGIVAGGAAASGMVVTSGADKTLRVFDPTSSFTETTCVALTDFPYSLAAAGGLALVGCGDGTVHVVDVAAGGGTALLYALGANRGAVRALSATKEYLLCAGDDGTAITYRFT